MATASQAGSDTSPLVVFLRKNPWVYPVGILLAIAIVGYMIWMNNQPAHGTWRYGLCRAFMEFEYAFPPTYDVLSVEEQNTSSRFYMAETNPFGNERIVQVDCDYQVNNNSVRLVRLSLDRKPIPPARVAYYNKMIPTLMSTKLNTVLPPPLPTALDQLKR